MHLWTRHILLTCTNVVAAALNTLTFCEGSGILVFKTHILRIVMALLPKFHSLQGLSAVTYRRADGLDVLEQHLPVPNT